MTCPIEQENKELKAQVHLLSDTINYYKKKLAFVKSQFKVIKNMLRKNKD